MAIREKVASAKEILKNPERLGERLRVKTDQPEAMNGKSSRWSNKDLDPTPPEQRTWSSWSFFAFQFSIAFSPTTYNVGASLYAIGLNWWTIFIASSKSNNHSMPRRNQYIRE